MTMSTDVSFARSGESDPFGKCTEEIKGHFPESTKERFSALAALAGLSTAEYLRQIVNEHVYGKFQLLQVHHRRGVGGMAGSGQE